ncbi:MAG TPA: carboxypeptidase regulatory-like domain-containing protein, partial [Chitinophagales bacterium]|nr:carboxypeptidase regulatory-like domain-containing protein [Chitinophagales bacterium]
MRPNIFFIVMFLLGPFMVGAQTYSLSGSVTDAADNTTMPGASVKLVNQSDTTQWQGQVTDANGVFTFSNLANGNYHIIVTYIGYQAVGLTVAITGADKQLMPVALRKGVSRLKEVEIVAAEKHYEQKADTTVYNANAYKVNPDASAEDL